MWFLLALIAACLFGTGQVIVRKGQVNLPPLVDNILATIVITTVIVPIMILRGLQTELFLSTLPYALLVAFLYMTYYYVLSKGQLSITATLLATFPVVTVLLSFFFLGERPTIPQYLAIILVLIGALILSGSSNESTKQERKNILTGIFWGSFGAITQGVADFTTKLGTLQSNASTFTFLMALSYVPAVLCISLFDLKGRSSLSQKSPSLLISIIGVSLIELGLIPYNMAFEVGPASLVSTIGATQILVMVILAVRFLQDKLLPIQYMGIFSTLTGIVVLGLSQ